MSSTCLKTGFRQLIAVLLIGGLVGYTVAMMPWRMAVITISAALFIMTLALFRPAWFMYIFAGIIFLVEEYPAASIATKRWIRTPFYAKSIGIPGLYAYDLFFLFALLMLFVSFASRRSRMEFPHQFVIPVSFFLSVLMVSAAVSIIRQFLSLPVLHYDVSTVGFAFHGAAVYLIGFAQTKTFLYLFITAFFFYVLMRDHDRVFDIIGVMAFSIVIAAFVGIYRFFHDPSLQLQQGVPLFYDTASSMAFLLFIVSVVVAFLLKLNMSTFWKVCAVLMSLLLLFLIVLSFRRTVWLCSFIVVGWLVFRHGSKEAFLRKIFGIISVIAALLLVMEFARVSVVPKGVEQRVSSTTLGESSTLYRFMIYHNAGEVIKDAPVFGHGIAPLWNYQMRHAHFRQTYENVHSLYLWILFRWGIVGFIGFVWILWHFYRQGVMVFQDPEASKADRAVVLAAMYGMSGFLITAAFFPVYGMVRFMVAMGLLVAIVERLAAFRGVSEIIALQESNHAA